ncbi:MAG: hypothetical protein LBI82_12050 [Dysgonamonadaceae bacterium]|jgi:hypothetical protein|nr:hypothetical protein [Dysgonamonadaceae bacterium]
MEVTVEKQTTPYSKTKIKGKSLNEVVNNGWDRLSKLYGVDMRKIATQHNSKHSETNV